MFTEEKHTLAITSSMLPTNWGGWLVFFPLPRDDCWFANVIMLTLILLGYLHNLSWHSFSQRMASSFGTQTVGLDYSV